MDSEGWFWLQFTAIYVVWNFAIGAASVAFCYIVEFFIKTLIFKRTYDNRYLHHDAEEEERRGEDTR